MEFAKLFIQTMLTMMTSAFGPVVALASNEAIKHWMEEGIANGDDRWRHFRTAAWLDRIEGRRQGRDRARGGPLN